MQTTGEFNITIRRSGAQAKQRFTTGHIGTVGERNADLPLSEGTLYVAGAIGWPGFLTVSKDLRLKEPYSGTVQLYTSEIAEDLAFHLTEFEQVPSAVGLGVYVEPRG